MSELHKFICGKDHEFYLPLNLPQYITEIAPLFGKLKCPICEDTEIKMKFSPFIVIPKKDQCPSCGISPAVILSGICSSCRQEVTR